MGPLKKNIAISNEFFIFFGIILLLISFLELRNLNGANYNLIAISILMWIIIFSIIPVGIIFKKKLNKVKILIISIIIGLIVATLSQQIPKGSQESLWILLLGLGVAVLLTGCFLTFFQKNYET